MTDEFDKIIIGAGLYGLYSAEYCGRKGQKILVIECDSEPFKRATYINQARVHMGYHYPRSISTAMKSAGYFERFRKDYEFCINKEFEQVYATSNTFSYTDAIEFKRFCKNARIPCEELNVNKYFKEDVCDGAFLTTEYTYDAHILRDFYVDKLSRMSNVSIQYNTKITNVRQEGKEYVVSTDKKNYKSRFVLNATYASVNQILSYLDYEPFKIKYELCEIILCKTNEKLKNVGITVMDGPFFSIMPFGKTGYHSLTSVTFTPHTTSYDSVPRFFCQQKSKSYCSEKFLGNCNDCIAKPHTAWDYMSALAHKYVKDEYAFEYESSLFSMKPILQTSEVDDSRPTVIKVFSENPTFISVLSGKINTVYDLDEILEV